MHPDALEDRIDRAYFRYAGLSQAMRKTRRGSAARADLAAQVRAAWDEVERLVKQRSPRRVTEMEREQGLIS